MNRVPPRDQRARSLDVRRRRLQTYLDRENLDAVWFARSNSFAWLTGASNVIDRDAPIGIAAAGYDREAGFRVVTDSIEADRLREEALPSAFTVDADPWHERSLAAAVADRSPSAVAADFAVPGAVLCDPTALRQPLTDADIERYRTLGREVATAVESVCRSLSPTDTEQVVAADVRRALESRAIATPVVLVGGSERAQRYRHFTPTAAELGDYVLISVTAERGGLHASATRTVAFDDPDWLTDRHRAAATVEATALSATQRISADGGTAADVFREIQAAYDAVGWPDEWTNHHQGGAAGFAGREWIATPTHAAPVSVPMGYAWNPTVRGAKSEGTVCVTADRIEPLTMTDDWPTIAVTPADTDSGSIKRPGILYR